MDKVNLSLRTKKIIEIDFKNMKKVFLLIIICHFLFVKSFSQNEQTFKGTYNGIQTFGFATYNFYINGIDTIKNGKFNYESNKTNSTLVINGFYKNGKKDGKWIATGTITQPDEFMTILMEANYSEGNLNGTYKKEYENKINYIDNTGKSKTAIQKNLLIANMNDNHLVDTFSYIFSVGKIPKMGINGIFDKDGFLDDTWTMFYTKNLTDVTSYVAEDKYYYKNGFYIKLTSKNIDNKTTDVICDRTDFILNFINNTYSKDKVSYIIDNTKYKFVKHNYDDRPINLIRYNCDNIIGVKGESVFGYHRKGAEYFIDELKDICGWNYINEINDGYNKIDLVIEKDIEK